MCKRYYYCNYLNSPSSVPPWCVSQKRNIQEEYISVKSHLKNSITTK